MTYVSTLKPSPVACLKCGHGFVPGSPEPCWCPDCGRLCSAFDYEEEPEPEPEECQETPQQRAQWWPWLWITLAAGPLGALFIGLTSAPLLKRVPLWMKDFIGLSTGVPGMAAAILCGAFGALYCTARLTRGLRRNETGVVVALVGLVLFVSYLAISSLAVSTLLGVLR